MLRGQASAEGTTRYRDRFPQLRDVSHFRQPENVPGAGSLWLSSIGIGTYLGDPTEAADRAYTEALITALRSGITVLDTAINYRHQRSERNIGEAIRQLTASGELQREEIFVCTKAGYLAFDGDMPRDPRAYVMKEYVESGVLDPAQVAGGMHCMAPKFLQNQIERSRTNLGLDTIDLFYLHNPETQLGSVTRDVFLGRLREAFTMLEEQVSQGRLGYYGLATWNGFRIREAARDYLSLAEAVTIAREIGGEQHHFRFLQLPFNLAMPEAYGLANQVFDRQRMSLLMAAQRYGISVVGSATLYQGQLTQGLPEFLQQKLGTISDAETAIQFSRSAPGLITSLIGMGKKPHVAANLRAAFQPPTRLEDWTKLFTMSDTGARA
jgi:aryl-alcohol dehydrogenase-like predicted oxidoreductase